jgi:hypothetical protein
MVYMRMGLLDDAIREHLDLKRRSGADPGLVARKEREALSPAGANEPPVVEVGGAGLDFAADPPEGHHQRARIIDRPARQVPAVATSSRVEQETVEFDMRAVLYEEHPEKAVAAVGPVGPVGPVEPVTDVPHGVAGAAVDGSEQRQFRFGRHL